MSDNTVFKTELEERINKINEQIESYLQTIWNSMRCISVRGADITGMPRRISGA